MEDQQVLLLNMESVKYCNVCGRVLKFENGLLKEDVFEAEKEWGYFSKRDLEVHRFNMCEDCYEQFISNFTIPVTKKVKKEVL